VIRPPPARRIEVATTPIRPSASRAGLPSPGRPGIADNGTETDWFDDQLFAMVSRDPYGHVRGGMGWHYRTPLGLTAQCVHRMVAANCMRPEFQEIILSRCRMSSTSAPTAPNSTRSVRWVEIDYSPG